MHAEKSTLGAQHGGPQRLGVDFKRFNESTDNRAGYAFWAIKLAIPFPARNSR